MAASLPPSYVFGPFRLDTAKRVLFRNGRRVALTPKTFDMLLALVENKGRLLEKEEVMKRLWPRTTVEESNIAVNLSTLRKTLGEKRNEHLYIVTRPGRGYEFVAPVTEVRNACGESLDLQQAPVWLPIRGEATAMKSIAVLRFSPIGKTTQTISLQGLSEVLIARLSKTMRIVLGPAAAAVKSRKLPRDPTAFGRSLGVDYVLTGSVQSMGKKARVTVQLVRVLDNTLSWADEFDEDVRDVFAAQDSISKSIAHRLSQADLQKEATPEFRAEKTSFLKAWKNFDSSAHGLAVALPASALAKRVNHGR